MVRPIGLWSATMLAAAALACGGSTRENILNPSAGVRCQMTLPVPPFPAAGGRVTAQLSAARDCVWSARTSATWLQVEPTSGQGDAAMTLTASDNPQGRIRSATIDVNEQHFNVTQDAAPCHFEISPTTVATGHQGGRASVQVSTLDGCSWTTQSSQPWLRVIAGSGGDASGTIELAIDSNPGPERSALLTIASLFLAVNQSASPEDRTACRFSLDPGGRVIPAAGGIGSFSVSTLAGCSWGVSVNQPWVTILSTANLTGSGDVVYRVDPNPLPGTRSAAISAGTRRHIVQQDGLRR